MLRTRFRTPVPPVPAATPAGVAGAGGGRGRSARSVVDLDGLSWSATGRFGCPVPDHQPAGASAMAVSERFRAVGADGACWQACLVPPTGGPGRRWTLVLVADIIGPDNRFSTANDADWDLFDEMFGPRQWRRFVAVATPAASAAAASVVLPGLLPDLLQGPASGTTEAVA